MGRFQKKSQESSHILQSLIINLVCCFFGIALAQPINAVSKAFDSLNFPMEAITCLVNLLVFGVILIRGRLDLENGAREVLATRRAPELEKINGINGMGLTTIRMQGQTRDSTEGEGGGGLRSASVVLLSNGTPNCSMKQFMKSNAVNDVHSILLQYIPLQNARVNVTSCISSDHQCKCIVFSTVEEITSMIDRRMPGTLKRVSDSMCLLPFLTCLNKGCNVGPTDQLLEGLTERDSRVESTDELRERLTEGGPRVESPAAVCQIDVQSINAGEPICICIPMNDARNDNWTELLVSSFRSKDDEARGVRLMASEALQDYLDGQRGRPNRGEVLEYNIGIGSFIWPRFSEILINFLLTFWFKVDGFSSSLVARRTVRNYLVDSKGNGLAANAFLTKATVHFNADNTHVCQVLTFRGNRLSFITLSFVAGGVNMICFIGWAVLIAFDYSDSSLKLSEARVVAIVVAISIACFMDCLYMYSNWFFFGYKIDYKVLSVIISEIACIVAGSVVATILAKKVCGDIALQLNWVNSVNSGLQVLVWVKWVIGSCILDEYTRESYGYKYDDWKVLVFSSAFLLNAVLAGVRTKWTPSWPWEKNYLFNYIFQNRSHHAAHNASHPPITGC